VNDDVTERLERIEGELARVTALLRRIATDKSPRMLAGWSEIADYCGKSRRTLQRYQRSCGLPVFRWGSRNYTSAPLLDDWLMSYDRARRRRKDKEKGKVIATGKEQMDMPVMRGQEDRQGNDSRRGARHIPEKM